MIKVFTCKNINETNAYLIINKNNEAILIDTGFSAYKEILKYLKDNNLKLNNVLITQTNYLNIYGIDEIYSEYEPTVWISQKEIIGLFDPVKNRSAFSTIKSNWTAKPMKKLRLSKDGDSIELNGNKIKILIQDFDKTEVSTYIFENEKCIFSGNTLFKSYKKDIYEDSDGFSVNGSHKYLNNIKNILSKGEFLVYPAHYETGFPINELTAS